MRCHVNTDAISMQAVRFGPEVFLQLCCFSGANAGMALLKKGTFFFFLSMLIS